MAVLVGIDEAGYGPLLGPLVVSAAAFELPDELLKSDMWKVLGKSVGKNRSKLAGRLLVNDSKQAFSKDLGIKHLQRTTLACLSNISQRPANLHELLDVLCPSCLKRFDDYRWYQDLASRKLDADINDIAIASDVFARDLAKAGIKLLWIKTCCLDVAHYNKLVDAAKNKSSVLFNTAAVLIHDAFVRSGSEMVQIVLDRQGGRSDYSQGLLKMFPDASLAVLRQDEDDSSYEMTIGKKTMRLHFVVGADERFLPVSLASMVCKYVREMLNECMNDYYLDLYPGLKSTAGYWKDGLRFIEDLKKTGHQIDHAKMIRIK